MSVVTTETLEASGIAEEAANELITDAAFAPTPPIVGQVPAWEEGAVYAKGAYVEEKAVVYRSQEAANKEHKPSEDVDFAHWAPVSVALYPAQGSATLAAVTRTQAGYNEPPARSDAAAAPLETINPGSQIGLGQ